MTRGQFALERRYSADEQSNKHMRNKNGILSSIIKHRGTNTTHPPYEENAKVSVLRKPTLGQKRINNIKSVRLMRSKSEDRVVSEVMATSAVVEPLNTIPETSTTRTPTDTGAQVEAPSSPVSTVGNSVTSFFNSLRVMAFGEEENAPLEMNHTEDFSVFTDIDDETLYSYLDDDVSTYYDGATTETITSGRSVQTADVRKALQTIKMHAARLGVSNAELLRNEDLLQRIRESQMQSRGTVRKSQVRSHKTFDDESGGINIPNEAEKKIDSFFESVDSFLVDTGAYCLNKCQGNTGPCWSNRSGALDDETVASDYSVASVSMTGSSCWTSATPASAMNFSVMEAIRETDGRDDSEIGAAQDGGVRS